MKKKRKFELISSIFFHSFEVGGMSENGWSVGVNV